MRRKNALAKTPVNGITIGEVYQDDHGQIVLRMKKPGCNVYEVVTLEQLLIIIVATAQTVA